MIRRRFIVSAAASLGAAGIPVGVRAQPVMLSAAQAAPIADAVAKAMAATSTRGMSVTAARGGEIVYARGFGVRDVGTNAAVDADTIFPIGSITKQFTAAAIMLLVRDHRVDLDAKAVNYVPLAPHATQYSVRQLLQQTTGLANFTGAPGFHESIATSKTITPDELVGLVARAPLAFEPGTQFAYSNTNYVVLGLIVEAAARIPYGRFIHERIAVPLGLAHLTFGPPPAGANVTRGYEPETGGTAVTPWTPQATYSAGGLYAAPADLVRWDDAFFGGRLLDAQAVRTLTTPPHLAVHPAIAYAMGWVRDEVDGHPMIWHSGGVLGAHARNAYFPDEHVAVVVLANSGGFDETRVVRETFRALVPPSAAQLAAERERESTPAAGEDPAITAAAKAEYERWRAGSVDTARYDAVMQVGLTDLVRKVSLGLAVLGAPTAFVFRGKRTAPNYAGTGYVYRVTTPSGAVEYVYSLDPDGKIGGIFFKPVP